MPDAAVPAAAPAGAASARDRGTTAEATDAAALLLALLSIGETTLAGLPEAPHVARTAQACAALGARATRLGEGAWLVAGVGVGGIVAPRAPLAFGSAIGAASLVAAIVGAHPISARIVVDGPPTRFAPLAAALAGMGAVLHARDEGGATALDVTGPGETAPIVFDAGDGTDAPLLAAAILLAGLNAPGCVTVVGPDAALDPMVGLLRRHGARVSVEARGERCAVALEGQPELRVARPAPRGTAHDDDPARAGPESTAAQGAAGGAPETGRAPEWAS